MSYNARIRTLIDYIRHSTTVGVAAFGDVKNVSHLPVAGMPPVEIFGLTVWINPLPPRPAGVRDKRSTHRLMCKCPVCGWTLSAGRLHQHADTAACARRALSARH